jgi:hypothetical protein
VYNEVAGAQFNVSSFSNNTASKGGMSTKEPVSLDYKCSYVSIVS